MQLTINENEKQLLEEVIISEIDDIKEEIHHTDDFDFKEKLKVRLEILEKLLNKIRMLV